MLGIEDLFRNPGGGSDPGTYSPQEFYQPDDGQGRRVPQNWGDIVGGMLGQLGNVARARRNQEAQNLTNAWEQARSLGPEAMQQFLNNPQLPQWFKDKILGGITSASMDPMLRAKAQKIYTEVQAALKQIYDQAAAIEDPEARDKFIEQKIAELKGVYPNWGSKLQTLPKGPDGHYALPGAQEQDPFLNQTVMLPNGKPMINPATNKPYTYRELPKAVREKLEGDLVARQLRQGVTSGQTLRQVAPWLAKSLEGTSFASILDQPASSFLDENGEPDMSKIHNLIADAGSERDKALNRKGVVYIDPNTGKPTAKQDGSEGVAVSGDVFYVQSQATDRSGGRVNSEARLRFAAKVNALKSHISALQAEINAIERQRGNDIAWANTPKERKAAIQKREEELYKQLDAAMRQQDKLMQEDPDLGNVPHGPGDEKGAWGKYPKVMLIDAIMAAEGPSDKLDAQWRGKLDNRQWIEQNVNAIYQQWAEEGSKGDFLTYLQSKWAPVGAANDPKNKNSNWLGNVQAYLKQHSGAPATANPARHEYSHDDYARVASWMPERITKGDSFETFFAKVLEANPGIDKARVKKSWDAWVNKMKERRERR